MLTRLRLGRGEGELVEANPKIGRVFSRRRMEDEAPLGPESQFLDNFMMIRAMVEEMYSEIMFMDFVESTQRFVLKFDRGFLVY